MNVLVTGGSGFIGSALARNLAARGDQVANFSRRACPELQRWGIKTIRGDLSDYKAVENACQYTDVVFHVAAKTGVWGSYGEYQQSNVQGTENIVKACMIRSVSNLIFTSSASVVFDGNPIEGMDESLPYPSRSMCHYTASKALAEQCVLAANSARLKTLSLRPHLVWGPGDRHIIPGILSRAKAGKLRRIGDGRNLIDTTYIDNAVDAHICAAAALGKNPGVSGKAYFISNGQPIPLMDFVNNILKSAGLMPVSQSVSKRTALAIAGMMEFAYMAFGIRDEPILTRFLVHEFCTAHWFDIRAAKENLGYNPKISIQDGFKYLAAWLDRPELK
jgi:nucleoside-diphosphate-sugar epimerase